MRMVDQWEAWKSDDCDRCWPMRGLEINFIVMGQHTKKTQTSRLLGWTSLEANSVKSRACICWYLLFTESAPLGRFSLKVAMYRCLSVCAMRCSFFLGLSLALRSHDHFQASHWSPPNLQFPTLFFSSSYIFFTFPHHISLAPHKKNYKTAKKNNNMNPPPKKR